MRRTRFRRLAVVVAVLSVAGVTRAVAGGPGGSPSSGPSAVDGQARPAAASSGGYWLVGSDGNVYPFGVPAHGSLAGRPPARPIVGVAATPAGRGLLAGRHRRRRSSPSVTPASSARPAPSGSTSRSSAWPPRPPATGYWLVATDGGIFSFGDAALLRLDRGASGSTSRSSAWPPRRPAAATGSSPSDGGIFSFGDAGFFGSTGAHPASTSRSSAWSPSPTGGATGSSPPTAASSASATPPSPARRGRPAGQPHRRHGRLADRQRLLAGRLAGVVYAYGDAAPGFDGRRPVPAPIVTIVAPPHRPPPPSPPARPARRPLRAPGPRAAVSDGPFTIALIGDTGYNAEQDRMLLNTRTADLVPALRLRRPRRRHPAPRRSLHRRAAPVRLRTVRRLLVTTRLHARRQRVGRLPRPRRPAGRHPPALLLRRPVARPAAPDAHPPGGAVRGERPLDGGQRRLRHLNVPGPTGRSSGAEGPARRQRRLAQRRLRHGRRPSRAGA